MIWATPDKGIKFRVLVYIVDNTYWDDGNRTTQRHHDFASQFEWVRKYYPEGFTVLDELAEVVGQDEE